MRHTGRGLTRSPLAIALLAGVLAMPALAGGGARGAAALPPVPAAWPFSRLELGFADSPGGAADLRATAPFGMRYQYPAGGVNTGVFTPGWNDLLAWRDRAARVRIVR